MKENVQSEDRIEVGGDAMQIRVASAASDGAVVAYDVDLCPGGGPPMLHRHAAFELLVVQRGELAFYLEGESGEITRSAALPGEVVAIPSGCEHTVRNESGASAHAFAVISPGEEMERFARRAGELSARGMSPSPEEIAMLAGQCGIEITRPVSEVTG